MVLPTQNAVIQQQLSAQAEDYSMARLIIGCGGEGNVGVMKFKEMCTAAPPDFTFKTARIDTDGREPTTADYDILIDFTAAQVCELKANAELFGDEAAQAVAALGEQLHPDFAGHGSCTTRPITQCNFAYHRRAVIKRLQRIIDDLNSEGISLIKPILVASCGGGCGGATTLSFCKALSHDSKFRRELLVGQPPHLLLPPTVVVTFPLHRVRGDTTTARQERHISGNIYAWQLETNELYRHGMLEEAYLVPYYPSTDRTTQALADAVYDVAIHHPYFKSRDADKKMRAQEVSYFGEDGL